MTPVVIFGTLVVADELLFFTEKFLATIHLKTKFKYSAKYDIRNFLKQE